MVLGGKERAIEWKEGYIYSNGGRHFLAEFRSLVYFVRAFIYWRRTELRKVEKCVGDRAMKMKRFELRIYNGTGRLMKIEKVTVKWIEIARELRFFNIQKFNWEQEQISN